MRNWTLIILGTALLGAGLQVTTAQTNPPSPAKKATAPEIRAPVPNRQGPARNRADYIAKVLSLNDIQKDQIKPIIEEQTQKMAELTKQKGMTQSERETKFRAIREATSAKLKTVLTDEQFQKYTKMYPLPKTGAQPPAAPSIPAPPAQPAK